MVQDIETAKDKFALKKAKLELQERLLKEKEKKEKVKLLINLGKMVEKASLIHLDEATLLGALLDVKNQAEEDRFLKKWNEKGKKELEADSQKESTPIIISLPSTDLSAEVKNFFKLNKFKWNSFRKEWYGYGNKSELEKFFKDLNLTAEIQVAS